MVFQEGKRIEGDYYIIAVYDDPASCSVTFAAYELETDDTYCLPYTYTELDDLFRFNSEMMNPTNKDGRYHWVIERLDFIVNELGKKVLCLAPEPTPEEAEEDGGGAAGGKKKAAAKPFLTGKVDAATRAKLIKELETMDDRKLQHTLVQSEESRKRFLQELHQKRRLEQLKATQRMLKMDEEREDRIAKLEHIKKTTREKALKFKTDAEVRTQTVAQLEVLMKQKEAEAIRRLVDDKEREEHHREQRMDQAMQKKRAQERNWREAREVEQEKIRLLEKKRKDAFEQRQGLVLRKCRDLAKVAREANEEARRQHLANEEKKQQVANEAEQRAHKIREENLEKRERYANLEELRTQRDLDRENRRRREEAERLEKVRQERLAAEHAAEARKKAAVDSYLFRQQLEARRRKERKEDLDELDRIRSDTIKFREEERLRKRREEEYLRRGGKKEMTEFMDGSASPTKDKDATAAAEHRDPKEEEEFQKTFEKQERERRQAERDAAHAETEPKNNQKKKVSSMYGNQKQRNESEIRHFAEMKKADYDHRAMLEGKRLAKEKAREAEAIAFREHAEQREATFEKLEKLRNEREADRDEARLQRVLQKVQKLALGTAIPHFLPI